MVTSGMSDRERSSELPRPVVEGWLASFTQRKAAVRQPVRARPVNVHIEGEADCGVDFLSCS